MKKHLLLERHTGRRRPREHDGTTIRSNCRWCSDALEFTCWNGEVVRVAFALDCHDREVISWVATTAGISGEMIRDMMVRSVEQRFGTIRAPQPVQWLSENGSIFAAHRTIEIARALNLLPCFTPVESPESNGMAEVFVKTFKRDYVRVSPIPDAAAALALVDRWMEDYNTVHPHSRLGYRSPQMRFVPVKSTDQQDLQSLHRARVRLICERTALINHTRGLLAEYGTLQDRLVKELRLAGISTLAAANAWLPEFVETYNKRFGRSPANAKNLHRSLTEADDLDEILAWREARTVTRNLTLRYDRMMLLLDPTPFARGLAGKKVRRTTSMKRALASCSGQWPGGFGFVRHESY